MDVELMREVFQITDGCESLLRSHGLDTLRAVFDLADGDRLDKHGLESWRQRWRIKLTDGDGRERVFYLKRFDSPPVGRQIQRWRGGRPWRSSAGVEWDNARQLTEAGISAAEPVAYAHRMRCAWECRSFVMLAEVAGESLERWVPNNLRPSCEDGDLDSRRKLRDGLARFVARFHAAGFVHRDLYLCHIFIRPDATDGGLSDNNDQLFRLIDLQRVFKPRWRSRRWVLKDLAALNYSTPTDRVGKFERLRFLCRYVRACGRFGAARQLAGLIEARTARLNRRNGIVTAGDFGAAVSKEPT